jgi:hypothetical protein
MTDAGMMSRPKAWVAIAILGAGLALGAPAAQAQSEWFSFFGAKFGMTKVEIGQKWLPLSGGVYAVSSPAIKQIKPLFDHEGRLYEFAFSIELQFPDDPATLVNIAFQETLNNKWKKNAGIIVNLAIGREGSQVSIVHERLRDGYVKHLQGKMDVLLQP